jgi:hypothetical protein
MKKLLILIVFITAVISVSAQQINNDVFHMELPSGTAQLSAQAKQQRPDDVKLAGATGNIYSKNNLVLSYRVNQDIKATSHSLEIKQKQQQYLFGKLANTVVVGSEIVTYGNVRFLLTRTHSNEGECIAFTSEHNGRYAYMYGKLKFPAADKTEADAYLTSLLGSFKYN